MNVDFQEIEVTSPYVGVSSLTDVSDKDLRKLSFRDTTIRSIRQESEGWYCLYDVRNGRSELRHDPELRAKPVQYDLLS